MCFFELGTHKQLEHLSACTTTVMSWYDDPLQRNLQGAHVSTTYIFGEATVTRKVAKHCNLHKGV